MRSLWHSGPVHMQYLQYKFICNWPRAHPGVQPLQLADKEHMMHLLTIQMFAQYAQFKSPLAFITYVGLIKR